MNTRNSQVDPNILFQQAFQFQQNGRLQDAELMYKNLLQISPSHIGAKTMLGMLYVQTERAVEGIRLLKSSLIKDPKQFWAHNALGVGLLNTKKFQEAIFSFNKALILKPDYIDSYFNLGKTQRALRQYKDAIVSYSKCIDLDKGYASAYNNIGTIYLEDLKEYEKSVANFQQFVTLVPDSSLGLCNLGAALKELKRYDDALVSYDRAIQLKPDYAEAYNNQGVTFGVLKRSDDALVSYDRAIQLKPEVDYLLGNVIHTKMHLCDWLNLDILVNQLTGKIMKHEIATLPFIALALIDDPELQKQSAEIHINDKYPISNTLPKISKYPKHQKIRIGYFSADFCNHPVSYLTAELFELHNRDQFEIIAFSFGLNTQDSMRHRLEKGFDKFIDVSEKSDTQITLLAREMEIDIAVDLSGFTRGCRVGIFAMRAAPIQVNYLGYPGTMGAEYIDYIVADPTLIPAEEQCHYSERVVYLPNTYMINDSTLKPSEEQFSRKNFELPENSFIFACFNASYKITPATFSVWMRILGAVDNSVLWLSGMDQTAINNLKNKANECGINIDRIIFASRVPSLSDHLNRIKLADLFLDTFPYNAHTTSNDALRVGLPILTLIGKSFASRVAGSLLNAVGLPELITITQEKYESLAIELATNPEQLEKIKTKLVANLPSSPLCNNTKLFAHHIELAYQEMYQFYQAELAPDHIYVKN
jgi:protein O-GlcNAc transferase